MTLQIVSDVIVCAKIEYFMVSQRLTFCPFEK